MKLLSDDVNVIAITAKDISNLLQLYITRILQECSRIEWLFEQLKDKRFYNHRERPREQNILQNLLIIPQSRLKLY